MEKKQWKMVDELKLCFNNQYPTKSRWIGLSQLLMTVDIVNEELG